MELGLQLFSVRDELQKDYVGTLESISEIGYRNIELAFHDVENDILVSGMNPSELKQHLDRLNLKIVSTHAFPLEKANWDELIHFNLEIGSRAIVCPIAFFKTKEDVLRQATALNQYAERCKKSGLDFYYHNHFHEFQKFDGVSAFDLILEHTDPSLVKIEFDTYWALRGGVNPIDYLKKLGGRCDLIHQKDLPVDVEPINIFESMDDEIVTMEKFMDFSKPDYFTELGEGKMEIKQIIQQANDIGKAKYFFVEQDWTTKEQLESIAISFKNYQMITSKELNIK
ncbi:sugar phosphate isomerase/epimerase family protein [Metabacillus bambusae]|uniref:Sugar phosphate isomerase/epimerase n=1 Tax=Metabacillus bambusae TaxID=2795218 RepID=A0ABS3N7A5_9BACI|nr:sugar phosphate isomerase/epimerase [Metabacillus bambusae]MBO1514114.1 sugar phosphate isomerase/epimerase [Metabacillus bambusae]